MSIDQISFRKNHKVELQLSSSSLYDAKILLSQDDLTTPLTDISIATLFAHGIDMVDHEIMKNSHLDSIPLDISIKLIDTLVLSEIQLENDLKLALAKTARIFAELVLKKILTQQREIYPSTITEVVEKLDKVLETLPKTEVATKYELTCCKVAVVLWKSPTQFLKGFVKKYWKDALLMGIKKDATKSFGMLTDLLGQLSFDLQTTWCGKASKLNWRAIGVCQDRYPLHILFKNDEKWKNNPHLSLGLVEALAFIILKDPNIDHKKNALEGSQKEDTKHVGLIDFAKWNISSKTRRDKAWKVRYRAIEHLGNFQNDENLSLACIQTLFETVFNENKALIFKLLDNVYEKCNDKTKWIETVPASKVKEVLIKNDENQTTSKEKLKTKEEILGKEKTLDRAKKVVKQSLEKLKLKKAESKNSFLELGGSDSEDEEIRKEEDQLKEEQKTIESEENDLKKEIEELEIFEELQEGLEMQKHTLENILNFAKGASGDIFS